MTELLILRGVPGSGKSTYARALEGYTRVNRDEIRFTMYGKWYGVNEDAVTVAENAMIGAALDAGENVVLDATNLRAKNLRTKLSLAAMYHATVSYKDFVIDVDTAIDRDRIRGEAGERAVGEAVIRKFFKSFKINNDTGTLPPIPTPLVFEPYVQVPDRPIAYIVDTDGTVADHEGVRSPYDTSRYHLDNYREHVVSIVESLHNNGYAIIGLSGRDATFRDVTVQWWNDGGIPFSEFHMRPAGDNRLDALVKYEMFKEYIEPRYSVLGAFDDRPQVIRMWRTIGVPVIDVGFGKEF